MDRLEAAIALRIGRRFPGREAIERLLAGAAIETRAAFDMAIQRGDRIRAADVIQYEWRDA